MDEDQQIQKQSRAMEREKSKVTIFDFNVTRMADCDQVIDSDEGIHCQRSFLDLLIFRKKVTPTLFPTTVRV